MPTKKKAETKAKLATTKSAGKKNTAAELSATHTPAGAKSPKRVTGASGRKGNLADAIHDGLVGDAHRLWVFRSSRTSGVSSQGLQGSNSQRLRDFRETEAQP